MLVFLWVAAEAGTQTALFGNHLTRTVASLINAWVVIRLELDCVPHGFRSSFSTWSAEMGHDFALAEICLSHAVGSTVSRRYRRTGLFVLRIPIMEEWGRYVAPVRSVAAVDSDPTLTADPARTAKWVSCMRTFRTSCGLNRLRCLSGVTLARWSS